MTSEQLTPHIPPKPEKKPGSKNIVICCDGTGNEFGDCNSNVVKLYTALAIDNEQVGYYHPGVGTMGDPSVRNRIVRLWSQVKGLAFGAGFKDNVFDAYRYLMDVYNDGDRVFLFGFSRGAYTARAVAGLLDGYGLLCRGNEGHIPYAWRAYTKQLKNRDRSSLDKRDHSAGAFKETFSHKNFELHFVGLWDTVSSVGWITTPLRLYNVAQNHSIRTGRHAISVDERRCMFQSNLWGDAIPGQDILQVWFAGVHSDVGGGYTQVESRLSNITLRWMIEQAEASDLIFVQDRVQMVLGEPSTSYPETKQLYEEPRHAIVHKSLNGPWWPLEVLPGIHFSTDSEKEVYRVPLASPRHIPIGAFIHHSVADRMADKSTHYAPVNILEGTITPLASSIQDGKPVLYTFNRKLAPESDLKRKGLIALICLLDLIAVRIMYLLLAALFRLTEFLAIKAWPHIRPLFLFSIHLVRCSYDSCSHFVSVHLGPPVAHFFFLYLP